MSDSGALAPQAVVSHGWMYFHIVSRVSLRPRAAATLHRPHISDAHPPGYAPRMPPRRRRVPPSSDVPPRRRRNPPADVAFTDADLTRGLLALYPGARAAASDAAGAASDEGSADVDGEPLLLRVDEAAEVLGVSRSLAYEAIRAGQWDAFLVRVGTEWRVSRPALERWLTRAPADR